MLYICTEIVSLKKIDTIQSVGSIPIKIYDLFKLWLYFGKNTVSVRVQELNFDTYFTLPWHAILYNVARQKDQCNIFSEENVTSFMNDLLNEFPI